MPKINLHTVTGFFFPEFWKWAKYFSSCLSLAKPVYWMKQWLYPYTKFEYHLSFLMYRGERNKSDWICLKERHASSSNGSRLICKSEIHSSWTLTNLHAIYFWPEICIPCKMANNILCSNTYSLSPSSMVSCFSLSPVMLYAHHLHLPHLC